jgi:uncharacterized protein
MSVELRPLGVLCNIACTYCYQTPQRLAGNVERRYSLDLMKAAVEAEGGPFTLFGGEPLLLPLEDLESLWSWGFERYGANSVQTNGVPLRAEHIELFKRYKVHVGLSIDGPGALNSLRRARSGSQLSTDKATERSERAIEWLCAEGIRPGLIVTLHRQNASREALPALHSWFHKLDAMGIGSVVLHVLESENGQIRAEHALSSADNLEALLSLRRLEATLSGLRFTLFAELRALLLGQDEKVSCVWTGCDPYTTRAVRGVEGFGKRTNCGRVNKEGVDFVKSDSAGFERYVTLFHVDQAHGGCAGCRFFLMCKGYCPGTSIAGDWRNRTEYCEVWKGLFSVIEAELQQEGHVPLSVRADRTALEHRMVGEWLSGENPRLRNLLQTLER